MDGASPQEGRTGSRQGVKEEKEWIGLNDRNKRLVSELVDALNEKA